MDELEKYGFDIEHLRQCIDNLELDKPKEIKSIYGQDRWKTDIRSPQKAGIAFKELVENGQIEKLIYSHLRKNNHNFYKRYKWNKYNYLLKTSTDPSTKTIKTLGQKVRPPNMWVGGLVATKPYREMLCDFFLIHGVKKWVFFILLTSNWRIGQKFDKPEKIELELEVYYKKIVQILKEKGKNKI